MVNVVFRRRSLLLLGIAAHVGLFTLTGCGSKSGQSNSAASNPSAGQAGDDALLETQTQTAVATDPQFDGSGITASAKAGVITLTGTIPTAPAKAAAEADAKKTPGVTSVINSLTIKQQKPAN